MMHGSNSDYFPLEDFVTENPELQAEGEELLRMGKVGTIALAGGHGSRLGFDAPKGCYPISVVHKKSLYQLLAEKVRAASSKYGKALPLAVMTSDATHDGTIKHFHDANFFGLANGQVSFFKQENLPLEDDMGKFAIDREGNTLTAPDGNGAMFWHFAKSGLLAKWKAAGIQEVTSYPIDNALADPFQLSLIALNQKEKADLSLVGVKRASFDEEVGSLIERDNKASVIEYSEMIPSERTATKPDGTLKHLLANISYFCFSMAFMQKMAASPLSLPLHRAKKKISYDHETSYLWKSEYFIFDLLAYAKKTSVLYLDRKDYFAPLKNQTGPQSVSTVQKQLEDHDRRLFFALTGSWPPPDQPFEYDLYNLKR